MQKTGTIYILSTPNRTTLYVGVTSELYNRIWQHRNKTHPGSFTARYNCIKLVYYKHFDSITDAIAEEKRLKAGSRTSKENLINELNKDWKDLWEEIQD